MCSVLVADLVKRGSLGVARLIAYAIEMGLPLVRSSKMLWPLMAPLSEYKVSEAAKPDEVGTNGVKAALEYLLQTWPGLMYFGIQGGAVVQLIRCLPKETEVVISILKNLLRLEGPSASITDPLSGLLLDILLKGGLIEIQSYADDAGGDLCPADAVLDEDAAYLPVSDIDVVRPFDSG